MVSDKPDQFFSKLPVVVGKMSAWCSLDSELSTLIDPIIKHAYSVMKAAVGGAVSLELPMLGSFSLGDLQELFFPA